MHPRIRPELRSAFFELKNWTFSRCLAPGDECKKKAIRAHSVQNANAMHLLARDGHVKMIRMTISEEAPIPSFEDVGRNRASTFEGFCSSHDSTLFFPIDSQAFYPSSREQLFLYAYRSVARETLATMEATSKTQSIYSKRVSLGIESGNEPGPAGMEALQWMITAHETWKYKSLLDDALIGKAYTELSHEVFTLRHARPSIAVSSCFSLPVLESDEDWVRCTINLFPLDAGQSIAIFSHTLSDTNRVRRFLAPVHQASGDYQKYLISKIILANCENFVVAPELYEQWSVSKRSAITDFFHRTSFSPNTTSNEIHIEDERLFLF